MSGDSTCPSNAQLWAFRRGLLPDGPLGRVAGHVEHCTDCQSRLDSATDEDPIVRNLRSFLGREEGLAGWDLARLQARMRAIRLDAGPSAVTGGAAGEPTPRPPREEMLPLTLGQYELRRYLGGGGMGRVYEARHLRLNKRVAVKLLPPELAGDPRAAARFVREIEALGELTHPNVVAATDAGEANGRLFLVMELIDGLDLSALVRQAGPVEVADACELARQAALGLQYVHERRRAHRDLKPSNLMLASDGKVKVLDLGLARVFTDRPEGEELTGEHQAIGTADYMAPEQWQDSKNADVRADVYSLGCTLYKLLSGRPPYSGPSYRTTLQKQAGHCQGPVPDVRECRPDVPTALAALLCRLMAKKPQDRFAEPAQAAEALAPFTQGCDLARLLARARAGEAGGATVEQRSASRPHRRRLIAWAAAGLAAVTLSLSLVLFLHRPPTTGGTEAPQGPPGAHTDGWQDLLAARPAEVENGEPADRAHFKWSFDPALKEVWMATTEARLLQLGETVADSFDLEVTIQQSPGPGGAGLFLGLSKAPVASRFARQYQVFEVMSVGGRAEDVALSRRAQQFGGQGGSAGTEVASAPLPRPRPGEHRLAIGVRGGQVESVAWDGLSIPQAVHAAGVSLLPPGSCKGGLGVYARGTAVFRQAHLRTHEGVIP